MPKKTKKIVEKINQGVKAKKEKEDSQVSAIHQEKDTLKSEVDSNINAMEYFNNLTDSQKQALLKEIEKKKIRNSYVRYLKYVYPDFIITKFHALLANICQSIVEKVENGEKVRVLISVPFRHGKSMTITKTLPSWFVGRNPTKWAILTAYNADLAEEFSNNNRQLIKNYGREIFGIETNESQDNKYLFQTHKVGEKENPNTDSGIMGVGIQGGIVGHGGQLIIVDDPYKNDLQADNPTERENISRIFKSAVLTRTMGKGNAVIVIHTRWHDDDLIGELEKTGDWVVINIPLVWEKGVDKLLGRKIGQTLCPELGFDSEWAEMTRKAIGNRLFQANCQGKPYIEGGNLIKRSDIKWYDKNTKPSVFEELTLSCDLSFGGMKKENDPYCMSLWGRVGGDHYLLNIWGKRASFSETQKTLRIICSQYPMLKRKIIEKKAMGMPIIETLGKEIGGFIPYDPKGTSKESRFNSITPYFEGGNIYFPTEDLVPDIEEYVEQVLRFPNVGHDDFVDTISQYLLNYEYRYGGKIQTDSVYKSLSKAIRGLKI